VPVWVGGPEQRAPEAGFVAQAAGKALEVFALAAEETVLPAAAGVAAVEGPETRRSAAHWWSAEGRASGLSSLRCPHVIR
jgi:hypothetical protein